MPEQAPNRAVADLRGLPDEPLADLRARRGRRAPRRRQRRALRRSPRGNEQEDRHALCHDHAQSDHDGAHGPAVRRDDGERGVSQLVSVDLQQAERFLEAS